MRRIWCFLLALSLGLALTGAAAAVERTPKPINTIPDDQIAPLIDGQHHYLLLCTDVWHGNPKKLMRRKDVARYAYIFATAIKKRQKKCTDSLIFRIFAPSLDLDKLPTNSNL